MGFWLFFITLIWLFILQQRVKKLEDRLQQQPVPPTQPQPATSLYPNGWQEGQTTPLPTQPIPAAGAAFVPTPSALDNFVAWLKEDFLMKLGAGLVLLAILWFVNYAFAENWIGPLGRIMLGCIVGAALLVAAVWRIQTFRHQGGVLAVMGSSTIIFTLTAARFVYEMFTPATVLALMFGTIVFVTFLAVRYQSQALALASLILAGLSPVLTNSPEPSVTALFTYLLVVSVGALWVVWQTGWSYLTPASLFIVMLYSVGMFYDASASVHITLAFVFVFTGLYFAANVVSLVRRRAAIQQHLYSHLITALGTAVFVAVWIYAAAAPEWHSLLLAAWALVFALGIYVVYQRTANWYAFYLYMAISAGLIGAATAAELDGPALLLAYVFEITAVLLAMRTVLPNEKVLSKIAWLYAVPIVLSLESVDHWYWLRGDWGWDMVVVTVMTVVTGAVGLYFIRQSQTESKTGVVLTAISVLYAVTWVWIAARTVFQFDTAVMVSLVVYTVAGIAAIVVARQNNSRYLRAVGGVLIAGVMIRLLLIEVWEMDLLGRVITFAIVGALLISTAFIRRSQPNNSVPK